MFYVFYVYAPSCRLSSSQSVGESVSLSVDQAAQVPLSSCVPDPNLPPVFVVHPAGFGSHHAAVISRQSCGGCWEKTQTKPNASLCACVRGKKRPSAEKCLLSARNRSRPESRAEPEPRRTRSTRPASCSRRPCSSSWTHPRRSTWFGKSGSSGKYR